MKDFFEFLGHALGLAFMIALLATACSRQSEIYDAKLEYYLSNTTNNKGVNNE